MPLEKKVLVLLYTLAHQDTYRLIADRFNLSESTVHGIVMQLCDVLVNRLMAEYIVWPTPERQREIAMFFWSVYGISGVIGLIGEQC